MEYKSFYKEVTGGEGNRCRYNARLDVYGCGCQHNCDYCYARSLLDFRGLWHADHPSVADAAKVERKIAKLPKGTIIRVGGMTDDFMPLERKERATYKLIQACNKYGIGYLIVTKSDLVAEPEYLEILDPELAHVQISITSTDAEVSKRMERGAPEPERRIKAVETLEAHGIDTQIRLSPFMPEYIDTDRINAVACKKMLVGFLRANAFIKRTFKADYSRHTLKEGNYWHLPLEAKIEAISPLLGVHEVTVCEDVNDHYYYWRRKVNPQKDDCCNLRKDA